MRAQAAALTPAEILEATGQVAPPILFGPIIKFLEIEYQRAQTPWAVAWQSNTTKDKLVLLLPSNERARQPGVNLAIGHDLRQVLLGIPGRADDIAYPHLRSQEEAFERWSRELVMPAAWFRKDAFDRIPAVDLAPRYNVTPLDVITRGQDLEVTHLICRERRSYAVYCQHPWWKARRSAYFATHRVCEHAGCRARSAVVHHVEPHGYEWLGRELDEHLRALCYSHHRENHPARDQPTLF